MREATKANLLLAYGIVEYDAALSHMRAMRQVGVDVPDSVFERVSTEYLRLLDRWLWSDGDSSGPESREAEVLTDVKAWVRDNITDVEKMLASEGMN